MTNTQCGFKAFVASDVRAILENAREKRFAFDIEPMLRSELPRGDSVGRVPITWIDSDRDGVEAEALRR